MSASQAKIILVVDDEADIRDALAFDLQRRGYQVATAEGGREADSILTAHSIDLVITDVHMPEGDGLELLRTIKARTPSLPTFVFIGDSQAPMLTPAEVYNQGADAVFHKPFDRRELHEAIHEALLPAGERFKREERRFSFECPAGMHFLKSRISVQTKIINLGRGGAFVALSAQFPEEGEEVEFQLKTRDPPAELNGHGVVRWVRRHQEEDCPPGCGIEFTNLDNKSRECIQAVVSAQKTKSFIPRK